MMASPPDWNIVSAADLKNELDRGRNVLLLDVREPDEYASGRIGDAINISVRQLPVRAGELPKDRDTRIVAYCASGIRSAYATMFLRVYGYRDVRTLEHGIREWAGSGFPVQGRM